MTLLYEGWESFKQCTESSELHLVEHGGSRRDCAWRSWSPDGCNTLYSGRRCLKILFPQTLVIDYFHFFLTQDCNYFIGLIPAVYMGHPDSFHQF